MTLLLDSPHSASLAFQVVADDGQVVRARIDGRLAHSFAGPSFRTSPTDPSSTPESTYGEHRAEPVDDTTLVTETQPVPSFDEPLAVAIGSEAYQRRVLLNLSAVTGMETSGINWLLTLQKRMDAAGGRLVLHSLSPAARNVVRVLNLHGALRVAVDETDAAQRW